MFRYKKKIKQLEFEVKQLREEFDIHKDLVETFLFIYNKDTVLITEGHMKYNYLGKMYRIPLPITNAVPGVYEPEENSLIGIRTKDTKLVQEEPYKIYDFQIKYYYLNRKKGTLSEVDDEIEDNEQL